MGIVRKQSLFISIIIYLGFAIGALNVLYLFPIYFTPEQFGLTRVMFSSASTFVQLASLGIPAAMVKFFPYFNDRLERHKNDFLFLSILIPVFGFILVSSILFFFKDNIMEIYAKKSPIFSSYFDLVFLFSFFFLLHKILETYSSILFKNTVPAFIREILLRIFHLILILLFLVSWINFDQFINLYALTYFVGTTLLVGYLLYLKRLHISTKISSVSKRLRKPIMNYGGFLYGGGLLLIVAENIDTLLLAGISGLQSTAVFALASYVATIVQVPQKSMTTVIAPMIAQAWKDKNIPVIRDLYKKTAITQLCSSMFLLLLIWANIETLLSFLPAVYSEAIIVILIMGVARVIDQGMGANGELLNTSVYWRISFIADIVFVASSIPLNYYFISTYGVIGSAYANFVSLTFFNTFRVFFVWNKFKIHPFSAKSLIAIGIGAVCYLLLSVFPAMDNKYLASVLKSLSIIVLFIGPLLLFRVSDDINLFLKQLKNRILKI